MVMAMTSDSLVLLSIGPAGWFHSVCVPESTAFAFLTAVLNTWVLPCPVMVLTVLMSVLNVFCCNCGVGGVVVSMWLLCGILRLRG